MRKILLTLFAIGILAISLSAQLIDDKTAGYTVWLFPADSAPNDLAFNHFVYKPLPTITVPNLTPDLIDDYGTKPPTKQRQQAVVKFNLWNEILKGHHTPEQQAALLSAARNPQSFDESLVSLFTSEDAKRIFYAPGSGDISKFRTAYKLPVLADKRLYFVSLDKQGRAEAWRGWFAYLIANGRITGDEQINEVIRLSEYLDRQNVSELDSIVLELQRIFPDPQQAREVFGSIGPYDSVGKFCKGSGPTAKAEGNCVCSIDHYNYSCNDTCSGGSGCATTDGGCSIFWLRNCDGACSLGSGEIQ
jgi:hypothetical protein